MCFWILTLKSIFETMKYNFIKNITFHNVDGNSDPVLL